MRRNSRRLLSLWFRRAFAAGAIMVCVGSVFPLTPAFAAPDGNVKLDAAPVTPPAANPSTTPDSKQEPTKDISLPDRLAFIIAWLFSTLASLLQELILNVLNWTINVMQYNGF